MWGIRKALMYWVLQKLTSCIDCDVLTPHLFKTGFMQRSASPVAQLLKNPLAMWETWVWSLGWEDSPGEGKGYPLQYSGLENSIYCTVHGVTENQTWLSDVHFLFTLCKHNNARQVLLSSVYVIYLAVEGGLTVWYSLTTSCSWWQNSKGKDVPLWDNDHQGCNAQQNQCN